MCVSLCEIFDKSQHHQRCALVVSSAEMTGFCSVNFGCQINKQEITIQH